MIKKGRDLMVFVNEEGEDVAAVACATSCELSISAVTMNDETKDDPEGGAEELDYNDWTVKSDNVVGEATGMTENIEYESLESFMLEGTVLDLVFDAGTLNDNNSGWVPDEDTTRFTKLSGKAIITDLSFSAGSEGHAALSVTFKGVGALS